MNLPVYEQNRARLLECLPQRSSQWFIKLNLLEREENREDERGWVTEVVLACFLLGYFLDFSDNFILFMHSWNQLKKYWFPLRISVCGVESFSYGGVSNAVLTEHSEQLSDRVLRKISCKQRQNVTAWIQFLNFVLGLFNACIEQVDALKFNVECNSIISGHCIVQRFVLVNSMWWERQGRWQFAYEIAFFYITIWWERVWLVLGLSCDNNYLSKIVHMEQMTVIVVRNLLAYRITP